MRQATTRELYRYWNHLRGARLAPERAEIDPAAIRHILADTMILEADDERRFPVRISGTRLNALFLDEQKGHSFVGLFAPEERPGIGAMIVSVLDETRPVVAGLTAAPQDARPAQLELLLLPLRHQGKTHARVLGALTPTAIPAWLGLRQAACLRMVAMRYIDKAEPGPLLPLSRQGDTEPQLPGELDRRVKARRRSFCIVSGGRSI
ncbi:PAS domain-containing protein [uncultured Rhodoblastus sp.]|uniref:PAS domain-containing protein n=1 Tax=uncultured Rhodoblastus sp. TaxID=543037 RepID=UPI0025F5BE4B|nr:PAS domain-containing protein [uncultured Rhodoblastus sp.]